MFFSYFFFSYQCYAAQWHGIQDSLSYQAQWQQPVAQDFAGRFDDEAELWVDSPDKDSYDGDEVEVGWMAPQKASASLRTFHASGIGAQVSHMIHQSEGFCYISGVRAIHRDQERCAVVPDGGHWALEATSAQRDYECTATCVLSIPATISGLYNRNHAGDTPQILDLGPSSNRVCYLTGLRRLSSHSQECETRVVNGRWRLRGRSRHGDFRCEARCATFGRRTTMSREVVYSARGDWETNLADQSTFCYISNVRNMHLGDEHCRVTRNDHAHWKFIAHSNQDAYRCGATCASIPIEFSSITTGWRHIASARDISNTLAQGVSRANGQAVTDTWSSSFFAQLGSPGLLEFAGVAVSSQIHASTTDFVRSFITAPRSFEARCPGQLAEYVALYQFVVEGIYSDGSKDTVSTAVTRCHYSSSIAISAPQCPFQACGSLIENPSCQESLCDAWQLY